MDKKSAPLSFISFLTYSHIWIALGSLGLLSQNSLYFKNWNKGYSIFLFFGTISIYGIHRIFGMKKGIITPDTKRFMSYQKYTLFIKLLVIVGLLMSSYYFLYFDTRIKILLLLPILLSGLYIFPIFKNKKRLRDQNYIKIILISVSFTLLTSTIPFLHLSPLLLGVLFLERFIFILAITIPFDIRDFHIDKKEKVRTIPSKYGIKQSLNLSKTLLLFNIIISFIIFILINQLSFFIANSILLVLTYGLIKKTKVENEDLFFSFWVDGTMIFSFIVHYFFYIISF